MEMERTVSTKGQIVIPKDARKRLGLKPGSEIIFEVEGDELVIKRKLTPQEIIDDFGNVPKKIKGLTAKRIKKILEEEHEIP